MSRAVRLRLPLVVVLNGLFAGLLPPLGVRSSLGEEPGLKANAVSEETLAHGQELFARQWLPNDPRSQAGDGLGPVYNERSCLGCHQQGGPGGSAGAERNIEIITATGGSTNPSGGAFYSFAMSFGSAGFQYRIANNTTPARPQRLNLADLAQIHPGFRETASVVLHRFGPDPDYRNWRESVPGQHGSIFIRPSQRNPTPLFGIGLIEAIPDEAIEGAARRRFAGSSVRGRVSRLADGRIGRFGWKAQTASLEEFIQSAATVELGLEVPGRHQAGDPRIPAIAPPGLDMDQDDCDALAADVRSLPAPGVASDDELDPKEAQHVKAGGSVFKAIGCANCHLPKLGDVTGIYSDLLLHDMSPRLADTSSYGAFAVRDPGEAQPADARERNPRTGATDQEWRTPPLWGLRDSGPYLHDGRAITVDEAIRGHGGEAAASSQKYMQIPARERAQLAAFLGALVAPEPAGGE